MSSGGRIAAGVQVWLLGAQPLGCTLFLCAVSTSFSNRGWCNRCLPELLLNTPSRLGEGNWGWIPRGWEGCGGPTLGARLRADGWDRSRTRRHRHQLRPHTLNLCQGEKKKKNTGKNQGTVVRVQGLQKEDFRSLASVPPCSTALLRTQYM